SSSSSVRAGMESTPGSSASRRRTASMFRRTPRSRNSPVGTPPNANSSTRPPPSRRLQNRSHGKDEPEAAARADPRLQLDAPTERHGELPRNRETEAGPVCVLRDEGL